MVLWHLSVIIFPFICVLCGATRSVCFLFPCAPLQPDSPTKPSIPLFVQPCFQPISFFSVPSGSHPLPSFVFLCLTLPAPHPLVDLVFFLTAVFSSVFVESYVGFPWSCRLLVRCVALHPEKIFIHWDSCLPSLLWWIAQHRDCV